MSVCDLCHAQRTLFTKLFFHADRYDLSRVGRMKFNKRLGRDTNSDDMTLTKDDIISVLKELVNIRNGTGAIDDIDSLSNRRIRRVGEMVENQFRAGLERTKRAVLDRFGYPDADTFSPQDIFNDNASSIAPRCA